MEIESNSKVKRREFIHYIKGTIDLMECDMKSRAGIAYNIVGLWGSKYRYEIDDGSDIDEILTIAGELELDETGKNPDWDVLIERINKLK